MKKHEIDIIKSIKLNIIGTCNIVNECAIKNIKLIYFSSNYVYPGIKGNYKEEDPVLPWNNYGWSKLGGESAVQMYKNSLILRCALTEFPFTHKKAFSDVKNNFIYHKDFIPLLFKLISKKGVINVGNKTQTVFNFAKNENRNLIKIKANGVMPKRIDMSLKKLFFNYKKMKIIKTKFKNLLIIKQKPNIDRRGYLRETYKEKLIKKKFNFEYFTFSKKRCFTWFSFSNKATSVKIC